MRRGNPARCQSSHNGTMFNPGVLSERRRESVSLPNSYDASCESLEGTEKLYLYVAPVFAFLSPPCMYPRRNVLFYLS